MIYAGRYIPDVIRITGRPLKQAGGTTSEQSKVDLPLHVCKVCGKRLADSVVLPLCAEHDQITKQGRKKHHAV